MATPQDADLIIKLYDLRREKTMRKARSFFIAEFFPQGVDDVKALFADHKHPEYNAYFRQMTSYWEMAAAMVNHGSIDRDLFFDSNGEFFTVWAKLGDFIAELRGAFGPHFLVNLEKLIATHPNREDRLRMMKERFRGMAAQRAEAKQQ
jgi:hypothetical protein